MAIFSLLCSSVTSVTFCGSCLMRCLRCFFRFFMCFFWGGTLIAGCPFLKGCSMYFLGCFFAMSFAVCFFGRLIFRMGWIFIFSP